MRRRLAALGWLALTTLCVLSLVLFQLTGDLMERVL